MVAVVVKTAAGAVGWRVDRGDGAVDVNSNERILIKTGTGGIGWALVSEWSFITPVIHKDNSGGIAWKQADHIPVV